MSLHTPGPWTVNKSKSAGRYLNVYGNVPNAFGYAADPVARIFPRDGQSTDERDANARLIAAAPALLEALETIQRLVDRAVKTGNGIYLDEARDKARAAIAQATGEHNGS